MIPQHLQICSCLTPGYCPRFQRHMLGNEWKLCSGDPEYARAREKHLNFLHLQVINSRNSQFIKYKPCTYLGPEARDASGELIMKECDSCNGKARLKVFQCFHPGHILNPQTTFTDCKSCSDFVRDEEGSPKADDDHLDQADMGMATSIPRKPHLCHGDGSTVDLKNHFIGRTALFVGGGISLRSIDLNAIQKNHIITLAVNNVSELMRPTLWMCVDDPVKFPMVTFDDPHILKLLPRGWADNYLDDGKMVDAHPSVLFFRRNGWFRPEKFLNENTFNWGCDVGVSDGLGYSGGRSVMLVAIKLLWYLGCRRIVLLGCDFVMTEDEPYAHSEQKSKNAVESNNRKFKCLNDRFRALGPVFREANLEVLNASEGSRLDAFPFVKLSDVLGVIEQETT